MSRKETEIKMAERMRALLCALPGSKAEAVSGAELCRKLRLTGEQFRYAANRLYLKGSLRYEGATRARVYWRTVRKPPERKA